ncbi:hypothetical protein phi9184_ORF049 [Enterococcus phage 9184]|uniref:Uncharacterized protein n=1 Tax=Enterococcus phage 9184 TaxID=2763103 RepID=A0A7L8ZII9_9CAUD|nr:hypothetical protein phi9184_ORF049 [Enterococcus phage 9184]
MAIKMKKINYTKELTTVIDEQVRVSTGDDRFIYIRVIDNDEENAIVALTLKEAQRVKRYLEDAITTNVINWEEEK